VLGLIHAVRKSQGVFTDPIVVHCSAGCGRTGAFCAIDTGIFLLNQEDCGGYAENDDLVVDIVSNFRRQRIGVVQTFVQFKFCYKALLDHFNESS